MEHSTQKIRESEILGEGNLIFVTVGAGPWGFERLIKEMDRITDDIEEEVIMQIGSTKYKPINAKYYNFLPKIDTLKLYGNSRIVVSHAGVGSIISAFRYNKPMILVPRMKKYGEVFDDHQLEIAKELESQCKIKVILDVKDLEWALKSPFLYSSINFDKESGLRRALREYINELE